MASTQFHEPVASIADVGRLSAQLALAFAEDPVFGWLLPRADRRTKQLRRFFALEPRHVVLPAGTVWTAEGGVGALLELPPGRWRLPLRTQLAHGPGFRRTFGRRIWRPRAGAAWRCTSGWASSTWGSCGFAIARRSG